MFGDVSGGGGASRTKIAKVCTVDDLNCSPCLKMYLGTPDSGAFVNQARGGRAGEKSLGDRTYGGGEFYE